MFLRISFSPLLGTIKEVFSLVIQVSHTRYTLQSVGDSGVVDSYDFCDLLATDGAAVVTVVQGFGALHTRDHMVTGAQQRVAGPVHADSTVTVTVRKGY